MSDSAGESCDVQVDEKLEEIARKLENHAGNEIYMKAWRVAARIVRSFKTRKVN